MKKFKVPATTTTRSYIIVEAETADEAYDIACNTDGGDFVPTEEGDWEVLEGEISETDEELT